MGKARSRVRRPAGPSAGRGTGARGARCEPHRADVHGGLERQLAVRGAVPLRLREPNWLFEALYRYGFASQPTALARDDGLELTDCYISAVGRCAPPGNKPTPVELERCRPYLEAELRLLRRLRVVVALGRVAHDGWLKAAGWWASLPPRDRPAFGHGAVATLPDGTILLSSYHPSRQNTNTGKLTRPMWHAVFQKARRLIGE